MDIDNKRVLTNSIIARSSPVLGYLTAGILIGPYGLSIIRHVHGTKATAEFGVVFLMFNIGLELSVERLSSMKKHVFVLGSAQVLVTAVVVGLVSRFIASQPGPVLLQLSLGMAWHYLLLLLSCRYCRNEVRACHAMDELHFLYLCGLRNYVDLGCLEANELLFGGIYSDLAVVVLLILMPLISPNSSGGGVGFQAIAEALGLAAVKAIVAIAAIIAGGHLASSIHSYANFQLLRLIYKQVAENQNAEIFSANTLLVILGTSLLTTGAGRSMALGAFLAVIMGKLALLIGGKTILVAVLGRLFGISIISAIRVGLLLAPGGEFAFVAFGEAINQGIMSSQMSSLLFLVVGVSMALTPWLAAGGQLLASHFELQGVRSWLPVESETDDLQDHIIICGFGRVRQIITQLLSERLIPFVALDVRRICFHHTVVRALDLPVYFGDAGSREVLHKVGAERACAAAITLDTPGANYRTVWVLSKYFPSVKTFVRAHDVDHGLNLENAGATAIHLMYTIFIVEHLFYVQCWFSDCKAEPAVSSPKVTTIKYCMQLSEASGSSLSYGYSRIMSKPKSQPSNSSDNQITEGTLVPSPKDKD
ncbi:hypothetical protein HYC85_006190 [Camellia sinensis]|uniref:RCK N-terminal domain-containing protein n=1 Tax=Camellia sinensis TaxID=4442 RepID=A0A7J7HMY8_CAMSI|nr:hypothetical protein HYC85_006190 [Camellia sinensis]